MRRLKSSGLISDPKGEEKKDRCVRSTNLFDNKKRKHHTKAKHVANEGKELGFIQLYYTQVLREAVRTDTGGDGRSPDNVADDAVTRLTPLPAQSNVELLEVCDPPVDLDELGLALLEPVLRRREIDGLLNPFG